MPNQNAIPQYDPSQLKPYLDSVPTTDDVRHQVWTAVADPNITPDAFKSTLDKTGLDSSVKNSLWEYKAKRGGLLPLQNQKPLTPPLMGPSIQPKQMSMTDLAGHIASDLWEKGNQPLSSFAKPAATEADQARQLRDYYIAHGDTVRARAADLDARNIDPTTGFTQLITPVGIATLGAGPALEEAAKAGPIVKVAARGIEGLSAAAFGAAPAKDIVSPRRPDETLGEEAWRKAGDAAQTFLSVLGVTGSLAPRPTQSLGGAQSPTVAHSVQSDPATSHPAQDTGSAGPMQEPVQARTPETPIHEAPRATVSPSPSQPSPQGEVPQTPGPAVVEPLPTLELSPERRAAVDRAVAEYKASQQAAASEKLSSQAPVEDLTAIHKKIVEDAGGVYRGTKNGQVEVFLPQSLTENFPLSDALKKFVSVTIPESEMSDKAVKSAFARKVAEFSSVPQQAPVPKTEPLVSQPAPDGKIAGAPEVNPTAADAATLAPVRPVEVPQAPGPSTSAVLSPNFLQSVARMGQHIYGKSLAVSNAQKGALDAAHAGERQFAFKALQSQTYGASPEVLNGLREHAQNLANVASKQADVVQDIIKTDPIVKNLRQSMKIDRMVKGVESANLPYGAEAGFDARRALHQLLGDKSKLADNEMALQQRGIAREKGLNPDEIQPTGYKRYSPDQFAEIKKNAQTELSQTQDKIKTLLKEGINDYREKNVSAFMEDEEGAMQDAQKSVLGKVLSTKVGENETLGSRLTELRKIIGYQPMQQNYAGKGEPTVQGGVVLPPGEIGEKTMKYAKMIWNKHLEKIPSAPEWDAKVAELRERARVLNGAANYIGGKIAPAAEKIAGQRGSIGERIVDASLVSPSIAMENAKKAGLGAHDIDADNPAGARGWISRDGRAYIENGRLDHASSASVMFPELEKTGSAYSAMIDNGWIRKVVGPRGDYGYQIKTPDSKTLSTIENDLMFNGRWNKEVYIEMPGPRSARTITLDPGWGDYHAGVENAVRAEMKKNAWVDSSQGISGLKIMGGAAVGGAIGGAFGGYPGLGAGMFIGAISPAVYEHPKVQAALAGFGSILRNVGMNPRDWLLGKPQEPSTLPQMQSIRDAQIQDIKSGDLRFTQRLASLPARIIQTFDKLALVNDQSGVITRAALSSAPGQEFRQLGGKLPSSLSAYIGAYDALRGGGGQIEVQHMLYHNIQADAIRAGAYNHVLDYLDLQRFQRAYDVVHEHANDLVNEAKQIKSRLATPGLGMRDTDALQDRYGDIKTEYEDIVDRITQNKIAPPGFTPSTIAQGMRDLEQNLGQQKFAQVKGLADRFKAQSNSIADLLYHGQIIPQEQYNEFKKTDYLPLHRIMSDITDFTSNWAPKESPLYLNRQNVVKTLEGSTRIPRQAFLAAADVHAEALREVARVKALNGFLELRQLDPRIDADFKMVNPGYKAAPDEQVIGTYKDGHRQLYAVPKWLGSTLQGADPVNVGFASNVAARWISRNFRKGVTVGYPAYLLTRLMRDVPQTAMWSEGGIQSMNPFTQKGLGGFAKDFAVSLKDSFAKNQAWQDFARAGGTLGSMTRTLLPEAFLSNDDLGFTGNVARTRTIDRIANFSRAIEDAVKMTAYRRSMMNGMDPRSAMFEARKYAGAPDVSKAGVNGPALNTVFMFANAEIQDIARVFSKIKENPVRAGLALAAVSMIAGTLAHHNISMKTQDGDSLLAKVSRDVQNRNFIYLTGQTKSSDGTPYFYKWPKPDFARIITSPIETEFLRRAKASSADAEQTWLQALGNLLPGQGEIRENHIASSTAQKLAESVNPAYRVPAEEYANKQTYGNEQPIVPQSLARLSPQAQFNAYTSPTAIQIGQGGRGGAQAGAELGAGLGGFLEGPYGAAVGGAVGAAAGYAGGSPLRYQHILNGMLPGIGPMATSLTDKLQPANPLKQAPQSGMDKILNVPVVGQMASRIMGNTSDQEMTDLRNRYYDNVDKMTADYATFQRYLKIDPSMANQFMQAHKDTVWRGMLADRMRSRMEYIRAQETTISASKSPDAQKQAAMNTISKAEKDMLRAFNGLLEEGPSGQSNQPTNH